MKLLGLIGIVICLSSCSTTSIEYVPTGAPVKEYSKETELKVYNELKTCGDKCLETKEMLKDGYTLRQANRHINGVNK